jgi:hypothetical protein
VTDAPNGNSIRITAREVYDLVLAVKGDVAELRALVGTLVETNKEHRTRLARLDVKWYATLAILGGAVAFLLKGVAS